MCSSTESLCLLVQNGVSSFLIEGRKDMTLLDIHEGSAVALRVQQGSFSRSPSLLDETGKLVTSMHRTGMSSSYTFAFRARQYK